MNIILQHYNGELGELEIASSKNLQNYAHKINCEYKLIRGKPFREHLTNPCQKVFCIDSSFDQYANVCMLDIDVFANKNLDKSIFDIEGNSIHVPTQTRLKTELIAKKRLQKKSLYWAGSVYKFSLQERKQLRSVMPVSDDWMSLYNAPYNYEDEGILAELAHKAKLKPNYFGYEWSQCSFQPNPEKAKMIHIRTKISPNGPKRTKLENYKELVFKEIL
jgi:hypothetical protein